MKKPPVTIGITCFNDESFVRQCLESALNQDYPNLEVIVVDDCSTDRSWQIIHEYRDRVQAIRHESNSGGYLTGRREVIAAAAGDYVGHLDADDYLEPDFVSRHVEAFQTDPGLDWVAGNLNLVDADGHRTDRWDYRDFPTEPLAGLRRGYQTASVPVPKNGLFSLRFLRENSLDWYELPNTANGSDAFTCIKYLECNPKIRLIPYFGMNYRIHGNNRCGRVIERVKMTIDLKEYYLSRHNTLVYLYHPDLLRYPVGSDDYQALKYCLVALDFYRTLRDFSVPPQFAGGSTASEIEEAVVLFHEPIRRYAARSLDLSGRFRRDLETVLDAIGRPPAEKTPETGLDPAGCERYRQALERNPSSIRALNGLAECLFENGRPNEAQEYAATALRLAPQDPRTLNNAGVIAFACGRYAEAEILFKRALAADYDSADGHYNLCELWGTVARHFRPDPQRTHDLLRTVRWIGQYDPDHSRNRLMIENHKLRDSVLAKYKNRYSGSGRRILLHRPSNGALKYLMDSWAQVLNYSGIETRVLDWGEKTAPCFEEFRPDVFVTVADPAYMAQLDNDFIKRYRRREKLTIAHISTFEHEYPPFDLLLTFHLDPSRDPRMAANPHPLVSLPFGINPLLHYMRPGRDIWDYFFVGTNSPRKIERTKDYLLPIVQRYRGILAGTKWNIGIGELPIRDAAELYSYATIYPNYSTPRHMTEFNEVNERTFIIPACGGFELMDSPAALSELFDDDELAAADSPEQYLDMFEYYLHNPDKRLPVIERGMRRVYRDHTLFGVLDRLLGQLGIDTSSRDDATTDAGLQDRNAALNAPRT